MNSANPFDETPPDGPAAGEAPFAAAWHLAWTVCIVLAAGGLAAQGLIWVGPTPVALALMAAAAGVGALLALTGSERAGIAAIALWSLAGLAACLLTGGVAGPLAAWCLAPVAAGVAFGRPRLRSLGTAAGVAGVAVAALTALVYAAPAPDGVLAQALSALSLITITLGLGAGLSAAQRRARRAGARIRAVEDGLRELMDEQPLLLLRLAPNGRIRTAHGQPFEGIAAQGMIGRQIAQLAAPDMEPAVTEALNRCLEVGQAEAVFTPARAPEGWGAVVLRRLPSGEMLAVLRDAGADQARLRQMQAEVEAAEERSAGKSRFLANMSHELRTPLNAIMGFSDIMRQRMFGPISDRYTEYAELIHESGTHLLELINDVLDMSKIEAERFELSLEPLDARDPVTAVLRLMRGQADRAGVHLRGVLPTEPLEADADRRALKQITLNLISNALKFTPRGGSVTVTVQAYGEMLELIVADTGVGIAPQDLERLGRPFEQAGDADQKSAGSGLGLSLVRAFAQLHGGEMLMESTLGEGTTVIVRMPVMAPPIPAAARG